MQQDISGLGLALSDPAGGDQIKRCAQAVSTVRTATNAAAAIVAASHTPAGRAAIQRALRPQPRPRSFVWRGREDVYGSRPGGMIYRSQPARQLEWRGYEPGIFGPVVGRR